MVELVDTLGSGSSGHSVHRSSTLLLGTILNFHDYNPLTRKIHEFQTVEGISIIQLLLITTGEENHVQFCIIFGTFW